jgi:hypothetical protein
MSELLTVRDVATVLKCGEDAVVRRFAKVPGVIDLGKPETRNRRRYRVLRIPKVVVEQYLTSKSGRSVQIEVPQRAERRRKSARWENRAILISPKLPYKTNIRTARRIGASQTGHVS